ncbi:DUF4417 domain-containing protein [Butyrivibrio sp. MC2013]|uniref:DUF4417 domain-containing protein n=1 Tax=Butyrivibrio sp. MC2013 TaxID=1280686 RepID=UPI0003F80046|nr:DUF4417 domain-containing protein [Butyrivibrio sp. MC2013]
MLEENNINNESINNQIELCKKEQEVQRFFKWDIIENAEIVGEHHHPKLKAITEIPNVKRLVTLNNAPYEKHPEECGLCFYTKDSVIERIWNNRHKYVNLVQRFPLVCGLDYSILLNMYYPQQDYNCWRNYVMTYWMQQIHPTVVPNAGFADIYSQPWTLDGMPDDSWIAVTSQGCQDEYILKYYFLNGLHELVRQKHPRGLIVYGHFPQEWFDKFPIPIIVFPSYSEETWGGA